MAQSDLEVFLQERAVLFDENLDVSPGSPFDVQVIQPTLRRLGTDPFTVNFQLFAQERINQDFPDAATKEGDALTDLIIKINTILWGPFLREVQRVKNNLSFRDPSILTLDEAEALGANLFSERNRGTFSRGQARIYFAQPQSISISPANFVTTKDGLHFFPDSIQSIRSDEMLLNVEGTLYYFDFNVIAEKPGDTYNIGPDAIASIANVTSAVRITNKFRFRFGNPDESAVEFVDRTQQELSERSLVTLRGIGAQITKAFPEVTRLAVVGFNDPEMERDVLMGGGVGPLRSFGFNGTAVPDGEHASLTRRVDVSGDVVDFTSIIGPSNTPPVGWVMTVVNAFNGVGPLIRDLPVKAIVSATQLDLEDQVIYPNLSTWVWMLRKKEISLSNIPGGILFPDSPNGTVTVPDGEIHIGGATDMLVRGTDFDTSSLVITDLVDDSPILFGTALQIQDGAGHVVLNDYTLDGNYQFSDNVFTTLNNSKTKSYSIQIMDGAAAGSYRVIDVLQTAFGSPILTLDPVPVAVLATNFRWRLLDEIDIDLTEPKETRISGNDLVSVQNVDFFETASGLDMQALGVSTNDIVRVLNGPVAGDYTVKQVLAPFFQRVQVDRPLTNSVSNLKYLIFRPNTTGGVIRPFVRVTSVDLLDTSGQPVGSKIPYANPVDIRSRAFANVAHGVKVDIRDARLGLTSLPFPAGAVVVGRTLTFTWFGGGPQTVLITGFDPLSMSDLANQLNTALNKNVAFVVDTNRLGITSIAGETKITGGSAVSVLFGDSEVHSTKDVRSSSEANWHLVSPAIDKQLDVVQVLDGFQIGFYGNLIIIGSGGLTTEHNFSPEAGRHVQVGARSIGTARLFFLEPTSIELDSDARISTTLSTGVIVNYKPDPTNNVQKVPGLPNGTKPTDGYTPFVFSFASASIDFVKKGILPGDILSIDYVPVRGIAALADPVPGLALTTVVLSVNGGLDKTITYITDSTSIAPTDVTRAGVANQINRAVGQTICSIVTVGALQYLQFAFDGSVVIRKTGTANTLLGFSTVTDQNNNSLNFGTYPILTVSPGDLTIDASFGVFPSVSATPNQGFKIFRPGGQRIGSTEMANNKADAGLFFFDIQLVSEGTGDLWNIDADVQMTATGYASDGYFLTTDDPNTSFSPIEKLRMHLSRTFLDVGVSDDPENATQLSGQNIQVNYERSTLTGNVNNFVTADTERVVNESPLARHLVPYFIRFDLTYLGGSRETEVIPDVEKYIKGLFPNDLLEVSDIERIVSNRGATSIQNPLDLVAVVHNFDRSVTVQRSSNALNTGRLAAFIPDLLNITRKIS